MSTYNELLKDPRWKHVRSIILKRDGYKCTCCGSDKNLEVHHKHYYSIRISGKLLKKKPWEYNNNDLITLCKICHKDYHLHHHAYNIIKALYLIYNGEDFIKDKYFYIKLQAAGIDNKPYEGCTIDEAIEFLISDSVLIKNENKFSFNKRKTKDEKYNEFEYIPNINLPKLKHGYRPYNEWSDTEKEEYERQRKN